MRWWVMALSVSLRGHMCGMAAVGCGGLGQSSCGGQEEGQCEMVVGPSGMSRPHSAVSAVGKRQFIAASCVPQAGEKIP